MLLSLIFFHRNFDTLEMGCFIHEIKSKARSSTIQTDVSIKQQTHKSDKWNAGDKTDSE